LQPSSLTEAVGLSFSYFLRVPFLPCQVLWGTLELIIFCTYCAGGTINFPPLETSRDSEGLLMVRSWTRIGVMNSINQSINPLVFLCSIHTNGLDSYHTVYSRYKNIVRRRANILIPNICYSAHTLLYRHYLAHPP